jgi:hypothetical protein
MDGILDAGPYELRAVCEGDVATTVYSATASGSQTVEFAVSAAVPVAGASVGNLKSRY